MEGTIFLLTARFLHTNEEEPTPVLGCLLNVDVKWAKVTNPVNEGDVNASLSSWNLAMIVYTVTARNLRYKTQVGLIERREERNLRTA